jgi:hypothetical protein
LCREKDESKMIRWKETLGVMFEVWSCVVKSLAASSKWVIVRDKCYAAGQMPMCMGPTSL